MATLLLFAGVLLSVASVYGIYRMLRYGSPGGGFRSFGDDLLGILGAIGLFIGLFFVLSGLSAWGIDLPVPSRTVSIWVAIALTVSVAAGTAYCAYRGLSIPVSSYRHPRSWWEIGAVSGAILTTYAIRGWWAYWRGRMQFIDPNHCRKCGYDLTGNMSGVCPECGTRI